MFHGPVEEVWQGLHTQINLAAAAKRGAQETGGKTPLGAYRGAQHKAKCSGAVEGHVLSPAMSLQPARSKRARGNETATSCTLVQSARLRASHEPAAKRRSPWQLSALTHGQGLATRSCEMAGRRKREEEKGEYSTSSLLR